MNCLVCRGSRYRHRATQGRVHPPDIAGMTLVEVLMAVFLMGILITGLTEVLGTITRSITHADNHTQTMGTAPFAMARMVRFITDTDEIQWPPGDGSVSGQLTVAERTLDLLTNTTRVPGKDGLLDADTDADTLVNEGGGDVKEYVSFTLDKTDPGNWKLTEQVPDYTTVITSDTTLPRVICQHVTEFVTRQLSPGLVSIRLTIGKNEMATILETRVRAGLLAP